MTKANVNEKVNAPADKVWNVLGDFGGVDVGGMIESCDVEGDGVGAVRTIKLAGGAGQVVERLEAYDPASKTFTYAIINDDCPLPVANYSATVKIEDNGDDTCTVDWTGSFEPKGEEGQVVEMIKGIYTGGIEGARQKTGG